MSRIMTPQNVHFESSEPMKMLLYVRKKTLQMYLMLQILNREIILDYLGRPHVIHRPLIVEKEGRKVSQVNATE